jgi:hypothetical protein
MIRDKLPQNTDLAACCPSRMRARRCAHAAGKELREAAEEDEAATMAGSIVCCPPASPSLPLPPDLSRARHTSIAARPHWEEEVPQMHQENRLS